MLGVNPLRLPFIHTVAVASLASGHPPASREMLPHLARRESASALPAAQRSPPRWAPALNLQAPPLSVLTVGRAVEFAEG